MEIKLTADWIFLHNSEVFCYEGKCYFKIYDDDFQYYLTELALKTLNVKYECEELYNNSDVDYEHPFYHYSFENIEDIKDTCPELYSEFQKSLKEYNLKLEVTNNKINFILKLLETPKTLNQINTQLDNEFYKKEPYYEALKKSNIKHTEYLVDDLLERDLIRERNKKYIKA
jgi:hypothetical protein